MTSDNSKSQIRLFRSQNNKDQNLSFTAFEIQFKIRDLRLYYSTVHLLICDISPDIYQMKLLIRFYFHQKEFSALYKQTAIIYCKKEMYDYETEMKMVRRSLSLQFNQKNKGTSGLMEPLPSGLQQVDYTSARTGLEIESQWQSSLNQQKNIGIFQGFSKFFSTLVEKLIIGMFQV